MRLLRAPLPLALLALLAACSSIPEYDVDRDDAALHVARAEREIADGDPWTGFTRLVSVWEVPSLQPELRARAEVLMRASVLPAADAAPSSKIVVKLAEESLPRALRVDLWMAGARRMLEEGREMRSFREIRDLENALPGHFRRGEAAELVAEAGFRLAASTSRRLLVFRVRDQAPEVLDFLVLNYPSSEHCPRAYVTLAEIYEEREELDRAIESHEDLLRYHLDSEYAEYSEARIPYLRLGLVRSVEFDHREIVRARDEVAAWLQRHAGHELEPYVVALGEECERRLVDADLEIAEFYQRIRNAFGATWHAQRALEAARALGDAERILRCEDLIASLEESGNAVDPDRLLDPEFQDPVDTGFGVDIEEFPR